MITIRQERRADAAAREELLDLSYGEARFGKASERLREGRVPAHALSFVAVEGDRLVGTVRLWHVSLGRNRPALLLGPLAVHPDRRKRGVGSALAQHAIRNAARLGHRAVLLVGDAPYYGRFGFSAEKTGTLRMPGFCDPRRLLALELAAGALDGAHGLVAAGRPPRRKLELMADMRARADQTAAHAA
jgi:predicted N-acetyltransferase YhbS